MGNSALVSAPTVPGLTSWMSEATVPISVQPSVTEPGKTAIVSAEIPCHYEAFLEAMLDNLRWPVLVMHEHVLKEVKIIEGETPEEFETNVILDHDKMARFKLPDPTGQGRDRVEVRIEVKYSCKGRWMETKYFTPHYVGEPPDDLISSAKIKFLEDPFRIEYWWFTTLGTSRTDEEAQASCTSMMEAAFSVIKERKVNLIVDKDKQVFITDPKDKIDLTFDTFFDNCANCIKDHQDPQVEPLSETKFRLTYMPPAPGPVGSILGIPIRLPNLILKAQEAVAAQMPYNTLEIKKEEKKLIVLSLLHSDDNILQETLYTFTESPLALEVCVMISGTKSTSETSLRMIQGLIDRAVEVGQSENWLGLW